MQLKLAPPAFGGLDGRGHSTADTWRDMAEYCVLSSSAIAVSSFFVVRAAGGERELAACRHRGQDEQGQKGGALRRHVLTVNLLPSAGNGQKNSSTPRADPHDANVASARFTAVDDLRGKRYGEVLLISVGGRRPASHRVQHVSAQRLPAELWSQLDADSLAEEHGAAAALLNGPRYWLMDSIEKDMSGQPETAAFGGIDMIRQAAVELTSMNPAPYLSNEVSRNAVFVFDSGEPVFELTDPGGGRWVMQTWSQVVDPPALAYEDLPGLATRLDLPPQGWSYRMRVLDDDLRIDTSSQAAQVLQDDLTNSYSLVR